MFLFCIQLNYYIQDFDLKYGEFFDEDKRRLFKSDLYKILSKYSKHNSGKYIRR